MSKSFLIVNVADGKLGVIRERATFDEAVECAVKMASEQCDTPENEIRKELIADGDFISKNADILVAIAQTED